MGSFDGGIGRWFLKQNWDYDMGNLFWQDKFMLISVSNWGLFPSSFFPSLLPKYYHFSSVQFSRSVVSDSVTEWTEACQASLSITNSQSLLILTPIDSVMPSNHLILCHPLLLLPSIFPSIRVFPNESVLGIRWPKYWNIRHIERLLISGRWALGKAHCWALKIFCCVELSGAHHQGYSLFTYSIIIYLVSSVSQGWKVFRF